MPRRVRELVCANAARIALAVLALAVLLAAGLFAAALATAPSGGAPVAVQSSETLPEVGSGSLLYRSPISGKYEPVPLVHTDVAIDVRGLVAAATVTQQYVNSTGDPLEAIYVFPLPHDAAVYDMEIRIGDRIIRSVIKEREEAKRIYQAAKSEGKRAALVEEERPNIFTTSVANLIPGDRIEVHLRYVEPLRWEDGRIRLNFPTVVGPRYIPGDQAIGHAGTGWSFDTDAVPDASRLTPPVRNPDSRSGHDISIRVDLDPGFGQSTVKCVSHPITVRRANDGRQRVELAAAAELPNKDFILELQQAESTEPQTALFLSAEPGTGDTHFLLAAYPPTVLRGDRAPVEMLYLIDISGSMDGTSITQAREALLQALDRLRPDDRFSIVAFNHAYFGLSAEPLAATVENLEAARRFVRNLSASGGTQMLPALQHVMAMPKVQTHLRHILVLTDGDLGNEEQIFTALKQSLGDARLFTVAIGSAPNHFLATKMAQFGRGSFTHIANISEIRERMGELLNRIESPVLTDVKLALEGVEATDVYPQRVPDLFLRQPLVVYGRMAGSKAGTLRLTARSGDRAYSSAIPFDASAATLHPGITTLWARQRIEDAMDRWREAQEARRDAIRAQIVTDAIRYRLVTRFTSLVAVEEIVASTTGASRTVAVPTELPEGTKLESVFGAPATGTADAFLEALGVALLLLGVTIFVVIRKRA